MFLDRFGFAHRNVRVLAFSLICNRSFQEASVASNPRFESCSWPELHIFSKTATFVGLVWVKSSQGLILAKHWLYCTSELKQSISRAVLISRLPRQLIWQSVDTESRRCEVQILTAATRFLQGCYSVIQGQLLHYMGCTGRSKYIWYERAAPCIPYGITTDTVYFTQYFFFQNNNKCIIPQCSVPCRY